MSWRRWRSVGGGRTVQTMGNRFDQTDFSVVVKKRAPPPKTVEVGDLSGWSNSPIECSSVRYETVEAANRAEKAALKQLLTEFPD